MKKEYLLSQGEETHTKRGPECLWLRNHIDFITIFSPINFKKRLSRRDTDERFQLSTAQGKVKKIHKSSMR
jgi:hypothetical protein